MVNPLWEATAHDLAINGAPNGGVDAFSRREFPKFSQVNLREAHPINR